MNKIPKHYTFSTKKYMKDMDRKRIPEWAKECEGLTESEMRLRKCTTDIDWMENLRIKKLKKILGD